MSNFKSTVSGDASGVTGNVTEYFTMENAKLNGTSYSHYGSRQGLGSFMDGKIIEENLRRQKELMGDGFIKVGALDASGKLKTGVQTMNLNGKMMQSDENGAFLIIDQTSVNKIKEREEERRNYIEGLVSDASVSDEVCAMMTGTSVAKMESMLKANGAFQKANGRKLDAALIAVDACPSAIQSYALDSVTFSNAIRKLKLYISEIMPCVETLTNEKTIKHGDEITA